jgi:drug/metabolite transporter (DMT)-like permease
MSVVAPIAATGIALPVAVGIATGDRPSAVQAAGLALAVAGVLLASREGEAAGSAARQAVLLALGAALGFGLYFVLADVAADDSVLWLLVLARATAVLLLGAAALAGRGFVAPPRDALGTLTLVGLLDVGATGLYALANRTGDLSVVAVVGSLYPVATILLARVVLRERLRPAQAAGVGLAFAGVAAIAGG